MVQNSCVYFMVGFFFFLGKINHANTCDLMENVTRLLHHLFNNINV